VIARADGESMRPGRDDDEPLPASASGDPAGSKAGVPGAAGAAGAGAAGGAGAPGGPTGGAHAHGVWASLLLPPGAHGRISEAEWAHFLESCEPLHQWGGAYMIDEGEPGCVRIYLRDDSGRGAHACVRLDAARSSAARAGVARIEASSRRAADLITRLQDKPALSVADMAAQEEASRVFVETAEAVYRELLEP
jgi:hypothetical protein